MIMIIVMRYCTGWNMLHLPAHTKIWESLAGECLANLLFGRKSLMNEQISQELIIETINF